MVVVHRSQGLRFVIYQDDHPPPHVHVIGDGEAKFALTADGSPRLIWQRGFARNDVKRALDVVEERLEEFRRAWEAIHG